MDVLLDFLVRLVPMHLPSHQMTRKMQSLVPDGLEHPKYKSRRSYIGNHILCWKYALEQFAQQGTTPICASEYIHTMPNLIGQVATKASLLIYPFILS